MRTRLLALVISLTGCTVAVTSSSRTILGHEQSGAVMTRSVDQTALEVVHLLEIRRFVIVDQQIDAATGERVLKFVKIGDTFVAEKNDATRASPDDVGSVFYVWVTPTETGSTISLIGKPTLAGMEPCARDGVWLPCTPLKVNKRLATEYLSGHFEASIARGLLSELLLEGYATGPLPASAPIPNAAATAAHEASCKARRHEMLLKAVDEKDPAARQALLDKVPTC